jgi:hypothetical protein
MPSARRLGHVVHDSGERCQRSGSGRPTPVVAGYPPAFSSRPRSRDRIRAEPPEPPDEEDADESAAELRGME